MKASLRLGENTALRYEIFFFETVAVGFCPLGKSLFCVIRLFFAGGVFCGGLLVAFLKKSSAKNL